MITRPFGAGRMSNSQGSSGLQPWVLGVSILSVVLAMLIGYLAYKKWRARRYVAQRSYADNRRTQYYELERYRDTQMPDRRVRALDTGFGAKSGVSPISPGPAWGGEDRRRHARDFREFRA